jgi:hypothetical protein
MVHQLSLNEVSVALVIFDARNKLDDPLGGVRHWARALQQAQKVQGESGISTTMFLVQARTDRGVANISAGRIQAVLDKFGFAGYFNTSAKEGYNIDQLRRAIQEAINWAELPRVLSSELFYVIKGFLISEKKAGTILFTVNELYRSFELVYKHYVQVEDLRDQFETCIALVESRGLIRRLSFGGLVLLQPEFLDSYVAALLNAAAEENSCILEQNARAGNFRRPASERIQDPQQDSLLLIATVEELIRQEIALSETAQDGTYLVFPSEFTREWPSSEMPKGRSVLFNFEGPLLNIYSTLAVRLSHSGLFEKTDMWKNVVIFSAQVGGRCGIHLKEIEDGKGELSLFYSEQASEITRFQFEEYIRSHLERRVLPNSLRRTRLHSCPQCEIAVSPQQVAARKANGFSSIRCNVCECEISILDREERLRNETSYAVARMNKNADEIRDRAAARISHKGRIASGDFDVFLCHNSEDKTAVKEIAEMLKKEGVAPWLDEWELRPGQPWQTALEGAIDKISSAAVFVGRSGLGPWQQRELEAFINEFVHRGCPVIPVILPECEEGNEPKLPVFLRAMTWVDFRKRTPDPVSQLIWGITGDRDVK